MINLNLSLKVSSDSMVFSTNFDTPKIRFIPSLLDYISIAIFTARSQLTRVVDDTENLNGFIF